MPPTKHPEARSGARSLAAIGQRCIALRKTLSPTQAAFCKLLDIGSNTWSQYEQAHRRPALEFALLLKDRTAITLDWLYTGDTAGLPHGLAVELLAKLAPAPTSASGPAIDTPPRPPRRHH